MVRNILAPTLAFVTHLLFLEKQTMLRSRVLRLFVASLFTVVSTALPMLAQGAAEGAWQDLVMQG